MKWNWKSLSCVWLFATPWIYSPWNSPGQNTGVGSLSLLQGVFPTQGSNPGLPNCRQILYQLSHKGSPRILEWVTIPSPADLPNPETELGSPALQADSLPTELSGKPMSSYTSYLFDSSTLCNSAHRLILSWTSEGSSSSFQWHDDELGQPLKWTVAAVRWNEGGPSCWHVGGEGLSE